jgi:two-component system, cell cycle sensor histidine kinase and response regulator CckA
MEAVGRLAGGVAHDFNNALTVIRGHADFLLEGMAEDDTRRSDVEEIGKAAEHAGSLTRQLLAFSRQQVLHPQVLDLNHVVTEMEKMLRRLIGDDVRLETWLDPALGAVKADPGQMEQVIMNLAVNARDAMPGGGRITIETENVELTAEEVRRYPYHVEPGPYVLIAVSDTGHGMDAETQARIFEPFFTTKGPADGTGLGLSTAYGIVKQSGGYIWVDSEVGKGTTFRICLPRVEEKVQKPAASAEVELDDKPATETVLVVEDNDKVRSIVRAVLMKQGYNVLEASNGKDALELVEGNGRRVDLLVTDLVMPELGGRELAEQLGPLYPSMRVLFMSGYTPEALFQTNVFGPDTAFLQKPFTPDEFLQKVRAVLGPVQEA